MTTREILLDYVDGKDETVTLVSGADAVKLAREMHRCGELVVVGVERSQATRLSELKISRVIGNEGAERIMEMYKERCDDERPKIDWFGEDL